MKKILLTGMMLLSLSMLAGCSGQKAGAAAQTKAPAGSQNESEVGTGAAEGLTEDFGTGPDDQDERIMVSAPAGELVEIKERMFIAQSNDIYLNTDDYEGKTIKYEGIYLPMEVPSLNRTYHYVIRYGPGCCGDDGMAGFEVAWDGEWPAENDWCEAVGTIETYEDQGYETLRLRLTSLKVLDQRGAEFVSQ